MPNEKLGTLDIDIAIDFKKVKKALDKISSSVKRVSIQMAKSIGRAMRGIARASLAVTKKVVGIFSNAFRRIARIVRNAMIVSAVAITALLGISIKAATKQEDALFALQTALKLTGDDTVEAMKDYQNFASALQKTTVIGDEQTLMLLAQHKQLGVNTKDLKKAAEMTIGLSAATGRSQDTITRYVAEALQGEFNSLKRIIPELKGMTNETKMMAVVTKFAANGMKVAEGRILTTSGALQQMKNAVGDVTEVIGQPFLKSIVKSSKVIQKFAEDNQKLIGDFAQKVSDSLDRVKAKIVAFFSDKGNQDNLKEAFKNIVLVLKQIKDWFIKITKEAIAFLKTKEAADIMSKRLEDIKNLAVLIWENLKKAAKWLKDFLTNEKRVKAVVDGFKGIVATVIALGQVLGRATEQISKLSNLFLTLLGVTDENKRAIGKTILNVIGLAAGFGLLRKMGGLLVNNFIGLAKKVFSLQTAMLLLKGTMIAVK